MTTKIVKSYIPQTRIDSFRELISSGQFDRIKEMCVCLLSEYFFDGLTRPEISLITDKKEQCLTGALKSLVNDGRLFICGIRLNTESGRYNQVYKLVKND